MNLRATFVAMIVAVAACVGCDDSPTGPSTGALATIQVGTERYQVWLRTPAQIQAARAAQAGGPARIPNGRIVAGTEYNPGWSWHLEDVAFAEVAIEVCDGRPSDVEKLGTKFGAGRFCPWTAIVVSINEI